LLAVYGALLLLGTCSYSRTVPCTTRNALQLISEAKVSEQKARDVAQRKGGKRRRRKKKKRRRRRE
jgi:hypothetical protein